MIQQAEINNHKKSIYFRIYDMIPPAIVMCPLCHRIVEITEWFKDFLCRFPAGVH